MTDYQRILHSIEAYQLGRTTGLPLIVKLKSLRPLMADPKLIDAIIGQIDLKKYQDQKIDTLSNRELEVFQLIGLGLNSAQIAKSLQISAATVGTHRKKISRKLGLVGSRKLVATAAQHIQNVINNCQYTP